MELGLHIPNFTYPGGPATLADDLTRIAVTAEEAGFARVSVMDHLFQIANVGPVEFDMLEAYTTLGFLAARTEKVQLLAWVTAVTYREPGLLAKAVSTLDVLSKGRAWLGIGAAWNGEEAAGLGLLFPEHRRALRASGGGAADLPADVERQRGAVRGQALPPGPHPELPAAAAHPADPDRRRRGEEDPAPGGEVRAGVQPVRHARAGAQARRCCAATARPRAATTTASRRR